MDSSEIWGIRLLYENFVTTLKSNTNIWHWKFMLVQDRLLLEGIFVRGSLKILTFPWESLFPGLMNEPQENIHEASRQNYISHTIINADHFIFFPFYFSILFYWPHLLQNYNFDYEKNCINSGFSQWHSLRYNLLDMLDVINKIGK